MPVSGNYTAIVQVKVSDEQLLKQLNNVSARAKPVTVKVKVDDSALKNFNNQLNQNAGSAQNYGNSLKQVQTNTDKVNKSTKEAGNSIVNLGKKFADATAKVFRFSLSTMVVNAFYTVLGEAKDAVVEFDSALTEFNKVSDLSGESLDAYTEKLGAMGDEVARTRTEMLQASTEFIKAGATEEDAAQLAKIASLYQNIADAEISAGDSASFIISQMKAFNFTADESLHLIDAINEVSNKFSVSSTDVGSALTKTSSAMSALGNSFEETIG